MRRLSVVTLAMAAALAATVLIWTTASQARGPMPGLPYWAHASTNGPVAGRIFTGAVAVRVIQDERPWTLVCRARIAGYSITPRIQGFGLRRQTYDSRSCSFVVPRGAAGRLLRLTYFAIGQGTGSCWSCGGPSGGQKTWRIGRQ